MKSDKAAKLKKIKANLDILDKKYRESKGYGDSMECESDDSWKFDYIYQMISDLRSYVWEVSDELSEHESEGHIPPINGADKMQKALDVLGLSGDYEIQKPIIWASLDPKKGVFEVEYKKK